MVIDHTNSIMKAQMLLVLFMLLVGTCIANEPTSDNTETTGIRKRRNYRQYAPNEWKAVTEASANSTNWEEDMDWEDGKHKRCEQLIHKSTNENQFMRLQKCLTMRIGMIKMRNH